MMGVYLKHSDPVAEGCIGTGKNKTLMAHKTQRPLLRAWLHSIIPAGPIAFQESANTEPKSDDDNKEKQEIV